MGIESDSLQVLAGLVSSALSRPNQEADIIITNELPKNRKHTSSTVDPRVWLRKHRDEGPYVSIVRILPDKNLVAVLVQALGEEEDGSYHDSYIWFVLRPFEVSYFVNRARDLCGKNCE